MMIAFERFYLKPNTMDIDLIFHKFSNSPNNNVLIKEDIF